MDHYPVGDGAKDSWPSGFLGNKEIHCIYLLFVKKVKGTEYSLERMGVLERIVNVWNV